MCFTDSFNPSTLVFCAPTKVYFMFVVVSCVIGNLDKSRSEETQKSVLIPNGLGYLQ